MDEQYKTHWQKMLNWLRRFSHYDICSIRIAITIVLELVLSPFNKEEMFYS